LRQMIANEAAIQVRDGRISLDNRSCWVDIRAFEQLCTWAGQILESRDNVPAAPALRGTDESTLLRQIAARAIDLYGGTFLHSETDQYWTVTTRERLRSRYLRLISRMARLSEQTGNSQEAADYYLKGIETEPLAEEFHQGLMSAYIRLGRQAEALAAYKRCKDILQAELGIAPSAKTDALRAEILKTSES